MPNEYGLDDQDENGTYLEGPLRGKASISILVSAKTIAWLKAGSEYTGESVGRVAEDALEEAALDYERNER